jgi:hypothetical protein
MATLGRDDLKYLANLARTDIRKHQKSIDRFAPRPGQSPEEAAQLVAKFEAGQVFRQGVLARLREALAG